MAGRGDMSNFVMKLQNQNKADIQKRISEELAAQMAREQKKERKWRGLSSIIKSGVKMIDPTGGFISAGVDTLIDPIGRQLGAGADPSNLKARKGSTIFGGREGFKTAREGLQDSINTYKDKSLSDTLAGMVTNNLGGKLKGGLAEKLSQNRFAKQVTSQGIEDNPWLLTEEDWSNGGLVPKYSNGGNVSSPGMTGFNQQQINDFQLRAKEAKDSSKSLEDSLKQMDTAEADKFLAMMKSPFTRDHAMKAGRQYVQSRQGTTEDISQYVPEVTEGQDTYAKTAETAQLMKLARAGDDGALDKLAQIARATRPELANKNWQDLKDAILEGSTDINMYGGAYQDVNTQAAQQVQGMREGASKAAGLTYNPSGQGASQRGARLGQQTLSSGLSDIYAQRAAGREDAISGAFGSFDNMLLNIE